MKNKKSVLVIAAHPDDEIFGPGATIARYAEEGINVYTVVFSYGEMSHPHFKAEEIIKIRKRESERANSIIGGKKVYFLGLKETKFEKEFYEKEVYKKFEDIIKRHNPEKIFLHSGDDLHHDHRAVNKIFMENYERLNLNAQVYTFNVSNILDIKKRNRPRLVINTSRTFHKKINALKCFRSQINPLTYIFTNNILFIVTYIKSVINGMKYGCKHSEVFFKLK